MECVPRHHCLIYEGSASRHLPVLAAAICETLKQRYRCLYLNSPEMVGEMHACLETKGLDVLAEIRRGALILSSGLDHLNNGLFDMDAMLRALEKTLQQALADGYKGLWASGDMTWELGPAKDFSQLLDYEQRLEQFFQKNPAIIGVCQYHAATMPRDAMRQALLAHPSVFINESMALLNPHYLQPQSLASQAENGLGADAELDSSLDRLLQLEFTI
ncbi:MAG TPA: MEDS domain-containing protein [Terracidiphilus sp.]|nr:MEDS domain-containing protein [Terracidiphilus sp.]